MFMKYSGWRYVFNPSNWNNEPSSSGIFLSKLIMTTCICQKFKIRVNVGNKYYLYYRNANFYINYSFQNYEKLVSWAVLPENKLYFRGLMKCYTIDTPPPSRSRFDLVTVAKTLCNFIWWIINFIPPRAEKYL